MIVLLFSFLLVHSGLSPYAVRSDLSVEAVAEEVLDLAEAREARVIMLGEVYGRTATPELFTRIGQHAAMRGYTVHFAFEAVPDEATLERREAGDGAGFIDAMLASMDWQHDPGDGRQSKAWLDAYRAALEQSGNDPRYLYQTMQNLGDGPSGKRNGMAAVMRQAVADMDETGLLMLIVGNRWTSHTIYSVCSALEADDITVLRVEGPSMRNSGCDPATRSWSIGTPKQISLIVVRGGPEDFKVTTDYDTQSPRFDAPEYAVHN